MIEISAIVIGFFGSFHCVAMCGPVALALSTANGSQLQFLLGRFIYNLGRVTTYAILGLLAGLAGHILLLAGFQQSVSIGLGLLIILYLILSGKSTTVSSGSFHFVKFSAALKKVFRKVLLRQDCTGLFLTGLANGILPCGFVYLALTGAAVTQNPANGALYMILFGLGTIPAMMMVSVIGKVSGNRFSSLISKWSPLFMLILAIMLITRGLGTDENSCCNNGAQNTRTVKAENIR